MTHLVRIKQFFIFAKELHLRVLVVIVSCLFSKRTQKLVDLARGKEQPITIMAKVDNTPEEPKQETPAPVKRGASARETISKDADEILKGLDQAPDDGSDPEKTRMAVSYTHLTLPTKRIG